VKKIDEMYAFVAVDEDGDEGIPAFSNGQWLLPLVGADMDRVKSLMQVAQEMANQSQRPLKILRFSQTEQIGEVNPQ
jgi:hypothetical protein